MYRQYENPFELEKQLEELEAEYAEASEEEQMWIAERIAGLKERINFAWQDDEYEMEE